MRVRGIGGRILAASLVVVAVALGIVAIGVVRVGGDLFESLMLAAGDTADHARAMFDESVTVVLLVAAGGRGRGGADPRHRLCPAPRASDRAPRRGGGADRRWRPVGARARGRAGRAAGAGGRVQHDGRAAGRAGRDPPRVRRECVPRAANPAHEPAGLPRGAPGRRHRAGARGLRLPPGGGRPAVAAGVVAQRPGGRGPPASPARAASSSTSSSGCPPISSLPRWPAARSCST